MEKEFDCCEQAASKHARHTPTTESGLWVWADPSWSRYWRPYAYEQEADDETSIRWGYNENP